MVERCSSVACLSMLSISSSEPVMWMMVCGHSTRFVFSKVTEGGCELAALPAGWKVGGGGMDVAVGAGGGGNGVPVFAVGGGSGGDVVSPGPLRAGQLPVGFCTFATVTKGPE